MLSFGLEKTGKNVAGTTVNDSEKIKLLFLYGVLRILPKSYDAAFLTKTPAFTRYIFLQISFTRYLIGF